MSKNQEIIDAIDESVNRIIKVRNGPLYKTDVEKLTVLFRANLLTRIGHIKSPTYAKFVNEFDIE